MRQGDVRKILAKHDTSDALIGIVYKLAEECEDNKTSLRELADLVNKMSTVLTLLNHVADGMKSKLDNVTKRLEGPPQ